MLHLPLMVPMESFFSIIRSLSTETVTTADYVIGAIAIVVFVVLLKRGNWTLPSAVVAFFVVGLIAWGATNLDFGKTMVDDTINGGPAPAAPTNQAP